MPVYRMLPPDADRRFMPLDPDCADTLVVSLHKDVVAELARSQYEAAALLWLVLEQAGQERATVLDVKNFQVVFFLMPLGYLAPGEVLEAVDRLAARGFVERVATGACASTPWRRASLSGASCPPVSSWSGTRPRPPGREPGCRDHLLRCPPRPSPDEQHGFEPGTAVT